MKLLFSSLLLFSFATYAQKTKVHGVVKDAITNKAVIGATVVYAEGKGVSTDIEGAFDLALDNGEYTLKVSYVGYELIEKKITATGKTINLDFPMATNELAEIEVVADIAIQERNPCGFFKRRS